VSSPVTFLPAAARLAGVVVLAAALLLGMLAASSAGDASARPPSEAIIWQKGGVPKPCGLHKRLRTLRKTLWGRTRSVAARRAMLRRTRKARVACRTARRTVKGRSARLLVTDEVLQSAPRTTIQAASVQQPFRWGVTANTYGRGSGGPAEQDRVKGAGIGWLREEFNHSPNAAIDFVIAEAARRGLRVLPLLQTGSTLPADVDAYAAMVAAHVRRYGPSGEFWAEHPELNAALAPAYFEIYNEPYGDWYGPVEPGRYARVLRAAVTRGREANPAARYLMAVDRTPGGARKTWIDDLYAAEPNLNAYFDAVAVHPYAVGRAPDEPNDPWGFGRIADARRVLESHGAGAKPFWITEVGWTTCSQDPEGCVTEAEQAQYMEQAAELVRTRYQFVEALFFYHWRLDERDASNSEHFYGILHNDLTPKPAYHALRRITGVAG
jgi:hypothetical protein